MKIATIDFETHGIEARPEYPPRPVGVAIQLGAGAPRYLHWGHEHGPPNSTPQEATRELRDVFRKADRLLFHNAKFDLDVAEVHLGLRWPAWHRVFDTMVEGFLYDPNVAELSLKPMAERYLGEPPDERDAVRDWIFENVEGAKKRPKQWGAHIWRAPGKIVGPYACGDVGRTYRLHCWFMQQDRMSDPGMERSYDRERRCFRPLIEQEREGVPVDAERLTMDTAKAERALERTTGWIAKRLGVGEEALDERESFVDALIDSGVCAGDEDREWPETKTGLPRIDRDTLSLMVTDPSVLGALEFRSRLSKQLNTFARPWLKVAESTGRIYMSWNQVRNADERQRGKIMGARTGRLSSSPNVQNIPTAPPRVRNVPIRKDAKLLHLRQYIRAPRGYRLLCDDYDQQELRILAHFEGAELLQAYLDNPDLDVHDFQRRNILARTGRNFARRRVKATGFGIIYGMGLWLLGESTGLDTDDARALKNAYLSQLPGVSALIARLKDLAKRDLPLTTWGGRLNWCEPDRIVTWVDEMGEECSETRSLDYKMLNTLIQGSAGDVIKEVIARYHEDREREGRMLLTVHDEALAIAPTRVAKRENRRLRGHMESVKFKLPMPTTGDVGVNWADLK